MVALGVSLVVVLVVRWGEYRRGVSLWVVLEPLSATVDAGASTNVVLRVRNTGDIVEEYHVDVVGDPALWCVIEPGSVRVYPGTTATVRLTFTPPRAPETTAGPHPFGVRVTPVENADAVMVPEGNLTVTPFVDVRAELLPVTVRGWRRGKPRLVVDNFGNTTATAAVGASTSGSQVDFDIRVPSIQVPPGRAHFSVLRLRPERLLWLGQKVKHPFTTTLQLSGAEPVSVSGVFLQSAFLPRWMSRVLAGLLALLAIFAGFWFAINPSAASTATAQAAASSVATVVASTAAASSSASPSSSPSAAKTTAAPATSAAAAVTTSATVSVPPPVGWWKLNDSPNTVAVDTEGHNDATFTNGGWCSSPFVCATFGTNSSGQHTEAKTASSVLSTAPGDSFTVLALVDLYNADGNYQTFVSEDGTQNSGFYLQYMGYDHQWAFSRPGYQAPSGIAAQANVWTSLAGVYDASTKQLRIYVNGTLEGSVTAPNVTASGGPLVMGRGQDNGAAADLFTGAMANVQVYNVALTTQQIDSIAIYKK